MKYNEAMIKHSRSILSAWLKPGSTVYTDLRRVSGSGMTRHISLHIVWRKEIFDITYHTGVLLGERLSLDTGGLVIHGCGMDMGFDTVYRLAWQLFPKGFKCSGKSCPSNQHFNDPECRRDTFKGKRHTGDGGYALNQRWL